MKNKSVKSKVKAAEKSAFRVAGEAIGSIGNVIAEGKDMIVEAAQSAVKKLTPVKKAVSKKVSKKTVKKVAAKKSAAVKKVIKKAAKKITKKAPAKKAGKK